MVKSLVEVESKSIVVGNKISKQFRLPMRLKARITSKNFSENYNQKNSNNSAALTCPIEPTTAGTQDSLAIQSFAVHSVGGYTRGTSLIVETLLVGMRKFKVIIMQYAWAVENCTKYVN